MEAGPVPELVRAARKALELNQPDFAAKVGSSKRNVARWVSGDAVPTREQWEALARLLYPVDRALAARAAAQLEKSLLQLGLEAPVAPAPAPQPRPPAPALELLIDSIICAAAEAAGSAPQAVRASVRAAFERARTLNLPVEKVCEGLRAAGGSPG